MRTWAPLGLAVLLVGAGATSASADSINYLYNNLPAQITGSNAPSPAYAPLDFSSSLGLDASYLVGAGDLINLTGGVGGQTNGGQIGLSNWGTEATYDPTGANNVTGSAGSYTGTNSTGFWTNVTVAAYNYDPTSASGTTPDTTYTVGSQIATSTSNVFIDWSPNRGSDLFTPTDTDPTGLCSDGQNPFANSSQGGALQCGLVNLVNFSLNATLPSSFIFEISFSTDYSTSGPGGNPDDSLNLGLNPFAPSTGTNPQPDVAYLDNGFGLSAQQGVGLDGEPTISFNASTPEPATFGLIGFGLLGLGIVARKKKKNDKV